MLKALEQIDPESATKVKDQLYTFEDLLLLNDRAMQKVLGTVNTDALAFALIGADEGIKDKVLANLSRRASETLQQELEFRPSAPAAKIQEGRQALVRAMVQLDGTGELG